MVRKQASRFFAGVSFDEGHEGLVIRTVLPRGPADGAKLKQGDVVVAAGKRPLHSIENLLDSLRATTTLTILRKSRKRSVKLKSANLKRGIKAIEDIIEGRAVANRICDDDCNCSVRRANSICQTFYVIKGDGPRGGLLLEKNCTFSSLPPAGGTSSCGTDEYF